MGSYEIEYKVLGKGTFLPNILDDQNVIVRDEEDLKSLSIMMYHEPEGLDKRYDVSDVDLKYDMIIACILGHRKTSGYSIDIDKILKSEDSLQIYLKEKRPSGPLDFFNTSTCPNVLISLPRYEGKIVFR